MVWRRYARINATERRNAHLRRPLGRYRFPESRFSFHRDVERMSPRPQIDHIRRPQLLDAAIEVIGERGLQNTRIADVAERAGTSTSAVLYWFKTKKELLAEAMLADEERFALELDQRLAGIESPPARLLAAIDACVEDTNWTMWMELWNRARSDAELRGERESLDRRWREILAEVVRDGVDRGAFAHVDADEAALTLAALIDGLAVQVTLGDPAVTRPLMRKLCIETAERLLGTELKSDQVAGRVEVSG